jgi:hypothetical protein
MRFSDIFFVALAAGLTSAAPAAESKIAEKVKKTCAAKQAEMMVS